MDWKKSLNIAAIGIVAWLLIVEWNQFQNNAASQVVTQAPELLIPQSPQQVTSSPEPSSSQQIPSSVNQVANE